jgi:hypothetical protein
MAVAETGPSPVRVAVVHETHPIAEVAGEQYEEDLSADDTKKIYPQMTQMNADKMPRFTTKAQRTQRQTQM